MTDGRETQKGTGIAADLEPYRRLLETQRELIVMARRYEQTRRECEVLRDLMSREVVKRPGWIKLALHRGQQSLSRMFKRLSPATSTEPAFDTLNNKQPFSC